MTGFYSNRKPSLALRLIAIALVFGLISEPVMLFAQSRPGRDPGRRRSDRKSIGATQLADDMQGLDVKWIGKIAYDAIIRSERYIVGPGDTFSIHIEAGEEPVTLPVLVNAEGKLVIPYVGAIQLAGLNLGESRKRIQDAVSDNLRSLDVQISLARLRSFPVNVVGQVVHPGTYMVEGTEQVSELISQAGGLLKPPDGRASHRNIQIQRLSESGAPTDGGRGADLALWRLSGNIAYNPFLLDGDQIFVPALTDSVRISGAVYKPGSYEFVSGDRVSDLIALAGGLHGDAGTASAELLRSFFAEGSEERHAIQLSRALAGNADADLPLRAGDKLHVAVKERRVNVEGEVYFPGTYFIGAEMTLKDLIGKAGGFTSKASLAQSIVVRRVEFPKGVAGPKQLQSVGPISLTDAQRTYMAMQKQQMSGRLPVDFVALFEKKDDSQDILLRDGDIVRIPRLVPSVAVNGYVITPGAVPYEPGLGVKDYISRAGGLNEQAERGEIYVIQGSTGNWTKASRVQRVNPGDTIFVMGRKPVHGWRLFRETLVVLSQVAALVIAVRSISR